jgi:putative heme-binding domain-containing protein
MATLISLFSRDYLRVAAVTIFLTACPLVVHSGAQRTSPQTSKSLAEGSAARSGRKTFESVCAACHGLDGRGGERGPNIATRAEVQRLTDEETRHIVRSGIPAAGMPAFGALGVQKIKTVVDYLRILQGGNQPGFIPGDAQRGKSLFFGKAGCAKCHMINGAGGFLGADLSSYASKVSIEDIRNAITDPNKDLNPQARTVLVTTREGTKFTGIARNEDNFSVQLQSSDGTFHLFMKSGIERIEYEAKSLMPSDYGSVLSHAELDDLASYLFNAARATKQPQAPGKKSKHDEENQ